MSTIENLSIFLQYIRRGLLILETKLKIMTKLIKTYTLAIATILIATFGSPSVWGQSEVVFNFLPGTFVDFQGYERLNDTITLYYGNTFDSTYIWRTNGTTEGSYIIHRSLIRFGSFATYRPDFLGVIQGKGYFLIYEPSTGKEIWVVDEHGTSCSLWQDRVPGDDGLIPRYHDILKPKVLTYDNSLYMVAAVDTTGIGGNYLTRINKASGITGISSIKGGFGTSNLSSPVFNYMDDLYFFDNRLDERALNKYNLISGDESNAFVFDQSKGSLPR